MRGKKAGETSDTTLGIKEPGQKLPSVLTALYRLLCLSKARRPPEKRRRTAFENLAKSMLRYLDNCNQVKVGITELQEKSGGACLRKSVFPFRRWRSRP